MSGPFRRPGPLGALLGLGCLLGPPARAELPLAPGLAAVGVDARLGATLDPALAFTAEDGTVVRLGDALDGERPVVLALAWYRCRMVCGLLLAGLADAARAVDPPPGEAWRLLSVSYDAADTPADAREAHRRATARLPAVDWGFWTGTAPALGALATQLGVRVVKDPVDGEIFHPVVAFVLSPRGVVTRMLSGPSFDPGELGATIRAAALSPGPAPAPPSTTTPSLTLSTLAPRAPLVCARPESPPPVYRAWIRAAGLLGAGVATALVGALLRRGRRAAAP